MAPTAFSTKRMSPVVSRNCVVKASLQRQIAAATASLAAVALLTGAPAQAGVTFAEKPSLKSYKSAPQAAVSNESKPVPTKADKPAFSFSLPGLPSFGGGSSAEAPKASPKGPDGPQSAFNTQALWPLGVVASGAALFVLPKVDPGFEKMYETAWVKSSRADTGFGIGTEDTLKAAKGYQGAYYPDSSSKVAAGTKKIKTPKKAAGKTKKKGFSLF